jgi:hypothetical protein
MDGTMYVILSSAKLVFEVSTDHFPHFSINDCSWLFLHVNERIFLFTNTATESFSFNSASIANHSGKLLMES